MTSPAKRRVEPGGMRPPPAPRPIAMPLSPGTGPVDEHRRVTRPADVGESLRDWRRGGTQPQWVRSVGWTIVIALLLPLVLAAYRSVAG